MKKRILLPAVLMATLLSSSCKLFHRSAKASSPPPPKPALKLPEQPAKTQQASLPAPPPVEPQEPDLDQAPPTIPSYVPPWRPRGRVQSARNRGAPDPQPAAEQQTSNTGPVETAAASVPQLEEVLSREQQQAYNDAIDRDVGRAEKTVEALKNRRLSAEQGTYLERIKTFVQQAKDARKTDLFRAKNLAERASLLAEDLLRSVQ